MQTSEIAVEKEGDQCSRNHFVDNGSINETRNTNRTNSSDSSFSSCSSSTESTSNPLVLMRPPPEPKELPKLPSTSALSSNVFEPCTASFQNDAINNNYTVRQQYEQQNNKSNIGEEQNHPQFLQMNNQLQQQQHVGLLKQNGNTDQHEINQDSFLYVNDDSDDYISLSSFPSYLSKPSESFMVSTDYANENIAARAELATTTITAQQRHNHHQQKVHTQHQPEQLKQYNLEGYRPQQRLQSKEKKKHRQTRKHKIDDSLCSESSTASLSSSIILSRAGLLLAMNQSDRNRNITNGNSHLRTDDLNEILFEESSLEQRLYRTLERQPPSIIPKIITKPNRTISFNKNERKTRVNSRTLNIETYGKDFVDNYDENNQQKQSIPLSQQHRYQHSSSQNSSTRNINNALSDPVLGADHSNDTVSLENNNIRRSLDGNIDRNGVMKQQQVISESIWNNLINLRKELDKCRSALQREREEKSILQENLDCASNESHFNIQKHSEDKEKYLSIISGLKEEKSRKEECEGKIVSDLEAKHQQRMQEMKSQVRNEIREELESQYKETISNTLRKERDHLTNKYEQETKILSDQIQLLLNEQKKDQLIIRNDMNSICNITSKEGNAEGEIESKGVSLEDFVNYRSTEIKKLQTEVDDKIPSLLEENDKLRTELLNMRNGIEECDAEHIVKLTEFNAKIQSQEKDSINKIKQYSNESSKMKLELVQAQQDISCIQEENNCLHSNIEDMENKSEELNKKIKVYEKMERKRDRIVCDVSCQTSESGSNTSNSFKSAKDSVDNRYHRANNYRHHAALGIQREQLCIDTAINPLGPPPPSMNLPFLIRGEKGAKTNGNNETNLNFSPRNSSGGSITERLLRIRDASERATQAKEQQKVINKLKKKQEKEIKDINTKHAQIVQEVIHKTKAEMEKRRKSIEQEYEQKINRLRTDYNQEITKVRQEIKNVSEISDESIQVAMNKVSNTKSELQNKVLKQKELEQSLIELKKENRIEISKLVEKHKEETNSLIKAWEDEKSFLLGVVQRDCNVIFERASNRMKGDKNKTEVSRANSCNDKDKNSGSPGNYYDWDGAVERKTKYNIEKGENDSVTTDQSGRNRIPTSFSRNRFVAGSSPQSVATQLVNQAAPSYEGGNSARLTSINLVDSFGVSSSTQLQNICHDDENKSLSPSYTDIDRALRETEELVERLVLGYNQQ